jgi:hypothetical protein
MNTAHPKTRTVEKPEELVGSRLPTLHCQDPDNSDVKELDLISFDDLAAQKVEP